MEVSLADPAEEIKRLQRCINDLVSILGLPAMWSGGEPRRIVHTLVDVLVGLLSLDLVYVRLIARGDEAPIEMARVAQSQDLKSAAQAVGEVFRPWLGEDPQRWPKSVGNPLGEGSLAIMPLRLGLQGEIGVIVAGSQRADFPRQVESLLLSVAVIQAAIGLQEARLLSQQKRVATELDQRVAQRTKELAAANDELRKEIAERRQAEERLRLEERELKRSEARKAAILASVFDCVVTIDHEGSITEFNPAAERTFGYRREEALGKPLADLVIPSSLREAHRSGLARYLATGETRVLGRRLEMTATRADGSEFPVELAITRIPLDGPPCFTGYLRDVTERKRSEEGLRRSEALLAQAQRISSTGSFSWREGDQIAWSDQLYRIFELDRSVPVTFELIGARVHPDDLLLFRERIGRARRDGSDFDIEYRLQMTDHTVKYLHVVAHAARDQDGRLEYIGAIQDVTQSRLAQEALDSARSELARVARATALGALTASIAHEVNQPLLGILTNADTCQRMLAADPPNVDGARETIRRSIRDGERAANVIRRLRALFAKNSPVTEAVDLNEAAREVIALSVTELQKSQVILLTELAHDLPLISGDRIQLQQVILNLLLNAAEAMSGVHDRPRQLVIRTAPDEGGRVRLSVQDAGVGFEPSDAERLFQGFYTTKSGGMGIGLSVSRSIIENHHGRLWAVAHEGPGATFSFSVPCQTEGPASSHSLGDIQAHEAAGGVHTVGSS
jgi:PAS domain S-box-containing protein